NLDPGPRLRSPGMTHLFVVPRRPGPNCATRQLGSWASLALARDDASVCRTGEGRDPIAGHVNLDPGPRLLSPGMTHRFVVPAKAGTQLRDTSTWIPGLACARPG